MMDFDNLDVSVEDGICQVTLNRPEKFNAMSLALRKQMTACLQRIAGDTAIRVVVLTGAGRAFCAGGDISEFECSSEELNDLITRVSHQWFRAFANLPQPVIAAVNGPAAGAGCSLALGSDLIYASESAYFTQSFSAIGLAPDQGSAYHLPRRVGLARAKEMCFFADRVSAPQALEWGMINGVFSADALMDAVRGKARALSLKSPQALQMIKRMLNRSFESTLEATLDMEAAAQSFLFSTEGTRQEIGAFLKK
ncbi:enoyl-CoA hydratase [Bordetella parapertussis]|uniref:enoyl-CoA hydratase/isomerase family protein n=1 Tax=Bordetella parapertussis TaxID=519 RepID=UPI0012986591|nr:enoyl-CoA hydratase [Bordetella parapertussis]QGC37753.1 enoyl-CoA hydratase [Bordetella parapertussis]